MTKAKFDRHALLSQSQELLFQKSLKTTPIFLHFPDQTIFKAYINLDKNDTRLKDGIFGEAAFTTGMSGYQETATDPSFLGQHIIYTTAHVGNYEFNEEVSQGLNSTKPYATSLIARNFSYNKFLENCDLPLISDVDTRALTKYLSCKSKDHRCLITTTEQAPNFSDYNLECNELSKVSSKVKKVITDGDNPIVVIDYGIKKAIVNYIKDLGYPLVVVPHNTPAHEVEEYRPRMVFLSNGPGDPKLYKEEINTVRDLLKTDIPIRGICLGHQLIGLACEMETIKLPFGQRGANHPVYSHYNQELLITSQNHGYAIEKESFESKRLENQFGLKLFCEYTSLFDRSLEGLRSYDSRVRSVQFHPESNPGPKDASIFFSEIKDYLQNGAQEITPEEIKDIPEYHEGELNSPYKKILLIGSGPIKIGQASEFDYSGTQALKSLRELGFEVVLLNSNPATIMTDKDMSHRTYIEPITKETIKKIILKEKVDAVLSTMGGQTALNMCIDLEKENFLKDHAVALLGANIDTIEKTEDRELFAKELDKLGYKSGKRFSAKSFDHALELADDQVKFPLIIRRDFALGGKGAALVHNLEELAQTLSSSDIKFPITMEKSLLGWKELELEVMVDKNRCGVVICSIENIDPCGIHTGDSITVAPAQTISDHCYQQLRTMSLNIAKHMNVVAGGANVQFAVNPKDENDIVVIEMNPRVSRSSALASKATGYPIAKISAGLAVGLTLFEILNDITRISPVAFEPTLDYVAIKIPIFPFNKFPSSSQILGPQMRSVGEVLALGGSFNEAFMKALRATEQGLEIPSLEQLKTTPYPITQDYLLERLKNQRELSLLTVLEALRFGISPQKIHEVSAITPWFIDQMVCFLDKELQLKEDSQIINNQDELYELKKFGFSDKYLALLSGKSQEQILDKRIEAGIRPVFKAVDTCSGEFNALTPYFYSTYTQFNDVQRISEESCAIFGSGPNRIGQGIEFDYSCVKSAKELKEQGIKSILLNSNPETVSTDYDSSDRLYLSPLFSEDLYEILAFENPTHVITSFSGQTGINIRAHLEAPFRTKHQEFNFLGPSLELLDTVEDRKRFDLLTKEIDLAHTTSREVRGYKNLISTITEIGYPVIIRPSYVIGGESMFIFEGPQDIENLPEEILKSLHENTITFQVENYISNALEYDVDLIRDKNGNTVFTICEHIEYAGVHSGDSGMISPPVKARDEIVDKMRKLATDMANTMEITGPINFQFALKNDEIYCIEANPRGSRTIPFLSKAYDVNLAAIATRALLGKEIKNHHNFKSDYKIIKQSTFPFDRFVQDSIILGPKMRSTGETLGIDKNGDIAMIKSYLGNYPDLLTKKSVLLSLARKDDEQLIQNIKELNSLGFKFFATKGTYSFLSDECGIKATLVDKLSDDGSNIGMLEAIKNEDLAMVLNTPLNQGRSKSDGEFIRNTAIQYAIPCFTRIENINAVCKAIISANKAQATPVSLQEMTNE
ncbi:carbamoyl-phosphate synthase large subunit [Halobacteriovorax sp. XZX-3]|uniref:carbamoyl-phosphate synthase large subunit n=1 Tax=unclassified Halobacteriovorax TaxID=2639665 RepID=UPI0037211C45